MNFFFDTSSLFKLYHREVDSALVEAALRDFDAETIYLSEIAKLEFTSTVWKRYRMKHITVAQTNAMLKAFEEDEVKYTFLSLDEAILDQARKLFAKYGEQGLRTLDSIQLSTALSVRPQIQKLVCSDKLLHAFFKAESLPVW